MERFEFRAGSVNDSQPSRFNGRRQLELLPIVSRIGCRVQGLYVVNVDFQSEIICEGGYV